MVVSRILRWFMKNIGFPHSSVEKRRLLATKQYTNERTEEICDDCLVETDEPIYSVRILINTSCQRCGKKVCVYWVVPY